MLTSGLTLLTALSLWLFGGQVLNGFSFALVCGIIAGTYSTVFIASPMLIFWQNLVESREEEAGHAGSACGPALAGPRKAVRYVKISLPGAGEERADV